MSRTKRKKLPYLDSDNEFNIKLSRGLRQDSNALRDPDDNWGEYWGRWRKREVKKRMAKKHRQERRLKLMEEIRFYKLGE